MACAADTEARRLAGVLEAIARADTDSAEVLKLWAARAMTEDTTAEKSDLDGVKRRISTLPILAEVAVIAERLLTDNALPPPEAFSHGNDGQLLLVWRHHIGSDVMIVVGDDHIDLLATEHDRVAVRRPHISYRGGKLDAEVIKYLPKEHMSENP